MRMVAVLVFIVLILATPALVQMFGPIILWLIALLSVLFLMRMFARREAEAATIGRVPPPVPPSEADDGAVLEVMQVDKIERQADISVYEGSLRISARNAFERLKHTLAPLGHTPLLQPAGNGRVTLILTHRPASWSAAAGVNPLVHWTLFFLTFATTTFAGAAYQGANLIERPELFGLGLPFSIGLMAILGLHELGHFFTARYYGQNVTPPFFIPVPFGLGTFGAFIQLRSPSENRKALFDMAMAGPFAGLFVAVVALLIGLRSSEIVGYPVPALQDWFSGGKPGTSMLLSMITYVATGATLHPGQTLVLSPLAFAGWIGLIVTALNLIPIGQLDGGHSVHALFGAKVGRVVSILMLIALFAVAIFVRREFLTWAILVYFIAGTRDAPPLDDVTPAGPLRIFVGAIAFVVLALILVPGTF